MINILCLHGCNQNKQMFEDLTKNLRQIATSYSKQNNCSEFVWHYVEAKYDHSLGNKTWYPVELDVPKIGTIEMDHEMVDGTLDELDKIIVDLKIDVLVGFSQGGNVVDTYLVNKSNSIKCAVIFSGYDLVDGNRKAIETPVMNVYSDEDTIVPSKFMPIYKNMVTKQHDKGHKLPTSKPFVRDIVDFMFQHCK
jgi:predicted esterase